MKKIFIIFSIIVVACVCCLAGCIKNDNTALPDLSDCEIGYNFMVYPECEFDYETDEGYICHIEKTSATLTKKNSITSNQVISGSFAPYECELYIKGYTDASLSNKTIYVYLFNGQTGYTISLIIDETGKFEGKKNINIALNQGFYFSQILIAF